MRRHVRVGANWRQEVTSSSKAYKKSKLTLSLMSYLAMLMWIPTIMSQWISSWLIGRRTRSTSTLITDTSNIFFLHFPFSVWHAWWGGSSYYLKFESSHGEKSRGTHFTHTWMGQQTDNNRGRGCKVVLAHDPQSSSYQSPEIPLARMGFRIRHRIGTIKFTP